MCSIKLKHIIMIKYLISFLFLITLTSGIRSQSVKYIYPDSGYQSTSFPITIIGDGTEWMVSPYFQIFFDSTGVTGFYNAKINDTTITATVVIGGKAALIPRGIYVLDQFSNTYYRDSALRILLSVPAIPALILPPNNSENQFQNVTLLWDSNAFANTFNIQISTDSLFINTSFLFDTVVANTPLQIRPDFLQLGMKYFWRVSASNQLGTSGWSAVWNFRVRTTGISPVSNIIPGEYKLLNNYPNPFNPVTKINFQTPKSGHVEISIYDLSGKKISRIFDNTVQAGIYELLFDASGMPSGIYLVRMKADGFSAVNKIAFVK